MREFGTKWLKVLEIFSGMKMQRRNSPRSFGSRWKLRSPFVRERLLQFPKPASEQRLRTNFGEFRGGNFAARWGAD